MASHLEVAFEAWLLQNPVIPLWVTEHRFHPTRKWRFDFAWPDSMVAVEIEGGLRQSGRHQSYTGFLADAEKYEAALRLGWTVYRVPGPWVMEGTRYIWRKEVMETLKELLR